MRIPLLLVAWLMAPLSVFADGITVSYEKQVGPMLQKRCVTCHGALKQEGGLRLDTGRSIRKGGDTGVAVVAHAPDESLLIQRVTSTDVAERMPPEGSPLTSEEVAILRGWIAQGASSPADESEPEDPRSHWAFRPPQRPNVPIVERDNESYHPIDRFLSVKRREAGVTPLPEADRRTVLRRVYLDLIGLPPSPKAIDDFVADPSPTAYEAVVDRLLHDPAYGERWGRHWMDIWRYSDWYGRRAVPDVMNSYPHIWRWRDWIVASLNQDKPYDQMVREMLAADELYPGDDEKVVATGFLVRNWFKWNYENWMKDNVEHTAKAFLGLTVQCAHCHDHKYDPIRQREYFAFRAFFEPLELRQDRVAQSPDPGPFKKYVYAEAYGPTPAGRIRVFDEKLDALTYMYVKGDSRNRMEHEPPVAPGVPAVLGGPPLELQEMALTPEAFYPGLKSSIRDEERAKAKANWEAARLRLDQTPQTAEVATTTGNGTSDVNRSPTTGPWAIAQAQFEAAQKQMESLERRIEADDARYRGTGDASRAAQAAALSERELAACQALVEYLVADEKRASLEAASATAAPTDESRAALEKARQEQAAANSKLQIARTNVNGVLDASYSPLSPLYPERSTGRRAALANWLTNPENPLTARVAVNHIWMRHFGRGLVATPSNFGRSGAAPSHPEMLDWLATELIRQGWQMKPIHRMLVTSQVYRLASHYDQSKHTQAHVDPDNRWYWRANVRRMEAEVVRDSILATAEDLDRTLGGAELDAAEGLTRNRRSLYFSSHGEGKMLWLELFDAADVNDGYQRTTSVRPQQALALTNGPLTRRVSRDWVRRWKCQVAEPANDEADSAFIEHAFRSLLSRPPSSVERQYCADFLARQQTLFQDSAGLAASEAREAAADEARASLVHALFSHNDFVTIR